MAQASDHQLKTYLRTGSRSVEGWLETCDKCLITTLAELQAEQNIKGSVCEIGIHHGKLFLLLYLLLNAGETAVAIDLFEDQDQNTDHSGEGDRAVFLKNLRRHAGSDDRLHMIAGDSTLLAPETIAMVAGKIRLFSIDGGHSAEITRSDLALADASLSDDGIIIVDDYFNHDWPGVSEGTLDYFKSAPRDLAPFAIGVNKVFFCRPARADFYRTTLCQRRHEIHQYTREFLGVDVATFSGYDSLANLTTLTRFGALSSPLQAARKRWNHMVDHVSYYVYHG